MTAAIARREVEMESPDTEALLVRQAQEGSKDSFEILYQRHVKRVYALCLRLSSNVSLAQELTQDAFVRAWEMLPSFRGESLFSSWLHRLTVNVVLLHVRSRKRRIARIFVPDDLGFYDVPGDHHEPGAALDLEKALSSLPHQARIVFILHDVEGFLHEEIAEYLGVAVGTSKAQLHRARKKMKEILTR